jgi:hypothetical protein
MLQTEEGLIDAIDLGDESSTTDFGAVVTSSQQVVGKLLGLEVTLVVSLFNQLNGLAVGSLVSLVDSNDPSLTGEGLSEVMKLEVFVARVDISDIIVSLWLAVCSIDLPGTIVAELIHETVLHGGEDEVVDSVAVLGDIVFLVNVGIDSTTNTHHP